MPQSDYILEKKKSLLISGTEIKVADLEEAFALLKKYLQNDSVQKELKEKGLEVNLQELEKLEKTINAAK